MPLCCASQHARGSEGLRCRSPVHAPLLSPLVCGVRPLAAFPRRGPDVGLLRPSQWLMDALWRTVRAAGCDGFVNRPDSLAEQSAAAPLLACCFYGVAQPMHKLLIEVWSRSSSGDRGRPIAQCSPAAAHRVSTIPGGNIARSMGHPCATTPCPCNAALLVEGARLRASRCAQLLAR